MILGSPSWVRTGSAGADVRWRALKSAGVDLWPPINELTTWLGQLTARQTEGRTRRSPAFRRGGDRTFVTYDRHLLDSAKALGLSTASRGQN
jgi:hypothetical protein